MEFIDVLSACRDPQQVAETVREIAKAHPTHQQNFTRLCVAWLQHMAGSSIMAADGRTEDSVVVARKLLANVQPDDLYLRFI
jgi:hypothetical protein